MHNSMFEPVYKGRPASLKPLQRKACSLPRWRPARGRNSGPTQTV